MNDPTLTKDDQAEHMENKDLDLLMKKYFARQISEVKLDWPLEDGHVFSFSTSRQLSEVEYKTLLKLLQMAKTTIIKTPIVESKDEEVADDDRDAEGDLPIGGASS